MRNWNWLVCLLFITWTFSATAQWTPLDAVKEVKQDADGITAIMQSGGALRLQVCTDSIVHVLYSPTGKFPQRTDYVVTHGAWPPAQWKSDSSDKNVSISTATLKATIEKESGALSFFELPNRQLFRDGKRIMTPETVNGEKTYRAETVVEMYGSREGFYGLGQHQAGVWNYHGESVDVSQENTNIAVPMLLSSNGYGILWNNTSRTRFNNRFVHVMYISSEVADTIDYYFIYGPEFDKIIASYRELTGAAPLFGRWAYGFWQCKNRYKSQDEILGVAQKYRDLHLSADNIVQDWFWWNRKGEHVFNKN